MSNGKNRPSVLVDLMCIVCTGGLWIIWILIRQARNK